MKFYHLVILSLTALTATACTSSGQKLYVNEDFGFQFSYPAEADYLWDDQEGFQKTKIIEEDGTLHILTDGVTKEDLPNAIHFTKYISNESLNKFISEKWGEKCGFFGFTENKTPIYDQPNETIEELCRRDKTRSFYDEDNKTFIFYGLGQEANFLLKDSNGNTYSNNLLPFDFLYF